MTALFFGLRFFDRLEVDLVEFEFGFHHGARRGVDAPAEDVAQVDDRHGIEILVDDDRLRLIRGGFGFYDRFVESAFDLGGVGKCDVGVLAAVDRQRGFFLNVAFESYAGLGAAEYGCAGGQQACHAEKKKIAFHGSG